MTNHTRTLRVSALSLLALGGLALAGCGRGGQTVVEEPKSVTVARATRSTISLSLEFPARIRAKEEIVVSPKIGGRVASVRADVGQKVRAGEVLFTLEAQDYEAQTRQAKAALESARANLTRTSDSSLGSQEIQAQAAVKQAQVQYDDAKDSYARVQRLFNDGTASRQQLDSAKARFDSAGIALDTAKQNLSLLQDKGGPQSTGLASTQVDQAQAASDLAQSQLANTIIRSPITGVVAARTIDPGELVGTGSPSFVVIDQSSVTAETSVEESVVDRIRVGEKVSVSVDAAGAARVIGIVQTVSPAADARTQGYLVKVKLESPPLAVRAGMFARVFFPTETRRDVLVVPNTAIVTETGIDYVYVVTDGALRKTPVTIGTADDAVTEITAGLTDGASVVTEGQSFLSDGQKVKPAT
ncbi:MAG TPA: efflux RND transporter periplasmic adaptor subunit [Spirochaetia bacterium]